MQIVMLGTGPFAVPTFRALYATRHQVVALATGPLRTHRGKPVEPISSIREVARQHGTPIFDPEDVNTPDWQARLAACNPDLLVVCDYGQILAPATLAAARLGGVNLHASLLPKYRGAAPINWAIYNGDTETGVTVIHMTPRIDAGPCVAQTRVTIDPDETAAELEIRLAKLGARLVCESIDRLESGRAEAIPQDAALASKAPRLKKSDGAIDWSRPAAAIKNHIRAMEPWPKTYTFWHRAAGPPVRLILGPASVVECRLAIGHTDVEMAGSQRLPECAPSPSDSPGAVGSRLLLHDVDYGTVLEATGDRLVIAAGKDAVMPSGVQPSGKRPMHIAEFLRGYHVQPGDRFADAEAAE
jgi:methionyl-tRNA formyltransferase